MKSVNANKINRKSGEAEGPIRLRSGQALQFSPSATNVLPKHLSPGMLYDANK
jgi:hypothetical protein